MSWSPGSFCVRFWSLTKALVTYAGSEPRAENESPVSYGVGVKGGRPAGPRPEKYLISGKKYLLYK